MSLDVILEATRGLLRIKTRADARRIAEDLVLRLGGQVVPATTATDDVLPVDLSFGDGEPILPSAPVESVARMLLERHLPSFVEDVHRAVELDSQVERLAEDASIDILTGLPNRRMLGRALGRLRTGDIVIMIDLDDFKGINDSLGHDAGDRVLRALGRALRSTVRGRDTVGRYGGEEFVIILTDGSEPEGLLERFRRAWEEARPLPVTFSAGIAVVGGDPSSTLGAADEALYRAKADGRDRWAWAKEPGQTDAHTSQATETTIHAGPGFVAFSDLEVPDGGQGEIETAFRHRLGAVDGWPGFRSLEVWADLIDINAYAMVSWWDSADAFKAYMRSEDHRRSHDRIPDGDLRPRPRHFRRFRVVAR